MSHFIKRYVKMTIMSVNALMLSLVIAAAQTATLLPNAAQQYVDQLGVPLAGGSVTYYTPNTFTKKNIWLDSSETTLAANPVLLDAAGRPEPTGQTFGEGIYRQIVKDANGQTVWDLLTASTGSGGSGGSTTIGDGNPVGFIMDWAGTSLPSNLYMYATGTNVNRSSFPDLFTALTISQTITCSSGQPILSGISDTSQIKEGSPIEASCVTPGTTVVSKTSSTVTASTDATATTSVTATFFPWGNGDGSTTFNLPQLSGRVLVGRDNMGGSSSGIMASGYYGSNPDALGAIGGNNQGASFLSTSNMPPYTPSGTIATTTTSTFSGVSAGQVGVGANTGSSFNVFAVGSFATITMLSTSNFTGAAQGGTSAGFTVVQPSVTINKIIKVLPNTALGTAVCQNLSNAGTACQANTGTSGHTVPFLDTANTWSAVQTFTPGFSVSGGAARIAGNATAVAGPMTDFTIQGLTLKGSPDANNDFLILYDSVAGNLKKVTPGQMGSSGLTGVASLGGMTGAISCGTGLTCSASTISTRGVFTADSPPSAGIIGFVPAPVSGDTAANRILGASAAFVDRRPLYAFAVPTPFTLLAQPNTSGITPQTLIEAGPGGGTMTVRPSTIYNNIVRAAGAASIQNYAYVDPVSGSDAGGVCPASAPCKTLQYCFDNCVAGNIRGITSGPFNPFSFTSAGSANIRHRLSFDGPAVFKVNGTQFLDPSAMTFTVTGTPQVYSAPISGLSGSETLQRWSYNDTYEPGTGNLVRFPKYASLAALNAAASGSPGTTFGWFYDSGTKTVYVAFFNLNVNSNKSKMTAYYLNSTGDAAIVLSGSVVLLLDATYPIDFIGVAVQASNSGASDPTLLIDGHGNNIRQFVAPGNGIHSQGGFTYVEGFNCQAPQDDCFNFDPSGTGTQAMAIGHNLKGWYAGDTASFGTGITANKNGWSAHGGVNDIVMSSSFGRNFGPNVANTVTAGFTSYSWFVGIESVQVADGTNAGIGFYGNAGQPTAIRNAWVDTCTAMQEVVSLYGDQSTITIKQSNCSLNIPSSTTNGASITSYVRNAP